MSLGEVPHVEVARDAELELVVAQQPVIVEIHGRHPLLNLAEDYCCILY